MRRIVIFVALALVAFLVGLGIVNLLEWLDTMSQGSHDITILGTVEGGYGDEELGQYLVRIFVEDVTEGEETGSFPIGHTIVAYFNDWRVNALGIGDRIVAYCDVRIPGGTKPTFVESCWLSSPVVDHNQSVYSPFYQHPGFSHDG